MPKLTLQVCEKDCQSLRASGLTDSTIIKNEIRTEREALVFPYRDLKGDLSGFERRRPHRPRKVKGKPARYEQPKGTPPQPYFPARCIRRLAEIKNPIFITEGEKKALSLSQLKLAAIGLGGVWCGCQKGTEDLIAGLTNIVWNGRTVYVVFDYDVLLTTRTNVLNATGRLARALKSAGAKEVLVVKLPPATGGGKQGVDDFLLANSAGAFDDLVFDAESADFSRGRISSNYLISSTVPKLGKAAYDGFAGDFIKQVAPRTEATDAGILAHLLPAVGMIIGPKPYVWGGAAQPARLNTALVGPTSTGRKGTSFVPVNLLMRRTNERFWGEQCVSGLSSGEGLIQKVSDNREKNDDGKSRVVVVEKRLYVIEPEFSRVLMQTRRDGNILSQVLRESYDSGKLAVLTRSPLAANNAHICVTGHITREELTTRMNIIKITLFVPRIPVSPFRRGNRLKSEQNIINCSELAS